MSTKEVPPMKMTGNLAQNWKVWKQKFNLYMYANEVNKKEEVVQCAKLLYYIGDEGVEIYNSFEFTTAEKDKLQILMDKFENYFTPKKNIVYERYKFFNIKQEDKTFEQLVTAVKNQAPLCEFGNLKDDLIQTMIIIAIKDEEVKEKLLHITDLTLEKLIQKYKW